MSVISEHITHQAGEVETDVHSFFLQVPYKSQHLDVEDWNEPHRACGMTCAWMALAFHEVPVMDLNELIALTSERGGLSPKGWIHDYLVLVFRVYGLLCTREEKMEDHNTFDRLVQVIAKDIHDRNPPLVSVTYKEDGSHIILLTGVRYAGEKITGFFYHDPDANALEFGMNRYMPLTEFNTRWRRFAIFPKRLPDSEIVNVTPDMLPRFPRDRHG